VDLKNSVSNESLKDKEKDKDGHNKDGTGEKKKRSTMPRSGSTPFDYSKWVEGMDPYETHNFITKSYKRPTHCDFCGDTIWGLGREGVKCTDCSFRAHRKCAKQIKQFCSKIPDVIIDQLDGDEDPDTVIISTSVEHLEMENQGVDDHEGAEGDLDRRKSSGSGHVMKGSDGLGVIMKGGEPNKGLRGWRGSDLNLDYQKDEIVNL